MLFMHKYLPDFPAEVFLQRTDIFKALYDLLEGGNSVAQDSSKEEMEVNLVQSAQQALICLLKKLRTMYAFLSNSGCKPSIVTE